MQNLFIAIGAAVITIFVMQYSKALVYFAISLLWLVVITWILFRAQLLPRKLMDILAKFTDKEKLLAALHKQDGKTDNVDASLLQKHLEARVIGQERVVEQIAKGIARRAAQHRKNKPIYSVLLSGPTGTGKTEMAKAIAEYMFGSENSMFRVDCGNLQAHGISSLVGSPKGYAGSEEWGSLTKTLRTTPKTLILFDEIEKAGKSPDTPLYKVLLSLLDEGRVTEQSCQANVSATQTIIIMTSNASQAELGEIAKRFEGDNEQLIRATKDCLQGHFAPELLARIDLVTTLTPLSLEDKAKVCVLHLDAICKSYGLELANVDYRLLVKAVEKSKTLVNYGMRELIRWLENTVSDGLVTAKNENASKVEIVFDNDEALVQIAQY